MYLYNTHLDAGTDSRDGAVQKKQLRMLTDDIAYRVGSNDALILAGDLNADFDELAPWLRETNLSIGACFDPRQYRENRQIDHILFRSGARVQLTIVESGVAEEFRGLSDHPAIFARIKITEVNSLW